MFFCDMMGALLLYVCVHVPVAVYLSIILNNLDQHFSVIFSSFVFF